MHPWTGIHKVSLDESKDGTPPGLKEFFSFKFNINFIFVILILFRHSIIFKPLYFPIIFVFILDKSLLLSCIIYL